MDIFFSAFDHAHQPGNSATHPQGVRRQTLALRAVLAQHPLTGPGGRLPLPLVVAGMSLLPPRFVAPPRLGLPSGVSN